MLAAKAMAAQLADIYDATLSARRLGWKAHLTSVWRPLYAPFGDILGEVPHGSSILDIGCGSGAFLFLAHRLRAAGPCYGIDVNASSIRLAQEVTGSTGIQFSEAMHPDPGVIGSVDVVTMLDVLHHIPAAQKISVLKGLLAAMRPGSRMIVKDLAPDPWWMAAANRLTDYASTRSVVSYIGPDQIARIGNEAGFAVTASVRLHKHVWSHYMVVLDKAEGPTG